jgi:hypothetical protein
VLATVAALALAREAVHTVVAAAAVRARIRGALVNLLHARADGHIHIARRTRACVVVHTFRTGRTEHARRGGAFVEVRGAIIGETDARHARCAVAGRTMATVLIWCRRRRAVIDYRRRVGAQTAILARVRIALVNVLGAVHALVAGNALAAERAHT